MWRVSKQISLFKTPLSRNLVQVTNNDGVATISLNRKPVNGLTPTFCKKLQVVIANASTDGTRGMILTSSLPTFSAGLDIADLYKTDPEQQRECWLQLKNLWVALYTTPFPTIAVINGHALAGGCLLPVSCDYRIMVDNLSIGFNETQLGLTVTPWFFESMKAIIGHRTTELALTSGEVFSTKSAMKIGLIDEHVSNDEQAMVQAQKFIRRFDKIDNQACFTTKLMIRKELVKKSLKRSEDDLNFFIKTVNEPMIQDRLGKLLKHKKFCNSF